MSKPTVLDIETYEALVADRLARLGLGALEVRRVLACRWPMGPDDVLAECRGRGLSLSLLDLEAYLQARYGELVPPDSVAWNRGMVDGLLAWAVEHERGEVPDPARQLIAVDDLLAALRSPDLPTRTIAGSLLALSLGMGLALAGEHREDVEHTIGPDLSALLGRAMSGEAAAVGELEALITANLPEKLRRKGAQ